MASQDCAAARVRRPGAGWIALLLALASLTLFLVGIDQPRTPMFDETHYLPAARAILSHSGPVNLEHPLFAKTLIAAGIALFGDNSLGWRIPSAVMGAVAVTAVYWVALSLYGSVRLASASALLVLLNQMHFIQSRIAMLDVTMAAFLLLGLALLMQGHVGGRRSAVWSLLAGASLGLAVGAKWTAIPYVALFLAGDAIAGWRAVGWRLKHLAYEVLPRISLAGLLSLLVYFTTFAPAFFYVSEPMTLARLVSFQFEMFALQSQALAPHAYQSVWWQWPLMLRPIWYLFEEIEGNYRAVLMIGNPVIFWGGLPALLACAVGSMKTRRPVLLIGPGLYLFSLAIWIVIPKTIGFFYYYYLSGFFLCLTLVAAIDLFSGSGGRWALPAFVAASAALFVYFYPVLSALPLPTDDSWNRWIWFESWR